MITAYTYKTYSIEIISDDKKCHYSFSDDNQIFKIVLCDDVCIVLLKRGFRNIVALNEKAQPIWQIRDIREIENLPKEGGGCYSGIYLDKEKNLWCFNFIGQEYRMNPKTGEILEKRYTK